jgi:hypothetical protein
MKIFAHRYLFVRIPHAIALGMFALSSVAIGTTAFAGDEEADAASFPQVEHKVKALKKRVKQLEAQVAELQTQLLPVEVSVDCTPGNNISDALAAHADGTGLLTIRVTGTCTESVVIARSNVVLEGGAASVIQTPPNNIYGVSIVDNASNVTLRNLTVNGGTAAILASRGGHASLINVVAQQASSGMMALDNGVLDVTGSTVRNNSQGVYAARGGVVSVSNSTIELNTLGVLAFKRGIVNLTGLLPDGVTAAAAPIVRNNSNGAVARSGGFIELADATIESNQNYGIVVDTGSTVEFFALSASGNRIANNAAGGVVASRNANLVFSDVRNTITANGRGIICQNNPSYLAPAGFTVTGNLNGDIIGCAP